MGLHERKLWKQGDVLQNIMYRICCLMRPFLSYLFHTHSTVNG
jgi:hypothetical protein